MCGTHCLLCWWPCWWARAAVLGWAMAWQVATVPVSSWMELPRPYRPRPAWLRLAASRSGVWLPNLPRRASGLPPLRRVK